MMKNFRRFMGGFRTMKNEKVRKQFRLDGFFTNDDAMRYSADYNLTRLPCHPEYAYSLKI